jgi:hypothetical protein
LRVAACWLPEHHKTKRLCKSAFEYLLLLPFSHRAKVEKYGSVRFVDEARVPVGVVGVIKQGRVEWRWLEGVNGVSWSVATKDFAR